MISLSYSMTYVFAYHHRIVIGSCISNGQRPLKRVAIRSSESLSSGRLVDVFSRRIPALEIRLDGIRRITQLTVRINMPELIDTNTLSLGSSIAGAGGSIREEDWLS